MTETNLQKGELSTYLASKKIVSLGLFDNLEDTRIAVNKYFELDSDYEAYKQIYGTNVDEWQVAYDKTFNVRGGKSGQSKIKNKVDNPRADTDAVINFRADAQFQNKRANYSLPINNRRNAQDRLSIGLKNQTLYSLANKMYPDQTNAIEIAELYNPNSQKDVVNQITSCKNALELFYIVKDFWLKVSNGYTDENGEEIEGTGIDLSELQCTIGGSEGDGTGTIDVRLKELGYEDKGRLGYYNPQTDTWHKKSISWQFGENVPQELVEKILMENLDAIKDKIPAIIVANNGKTCKTRIMEDEEYLESLNTKMQEELKEYLESGDVEELADLEEVLRAILDVKKVSYEEFEKIRNSKVEKRGAFKEKIFLESVSELDDK